MGHKVHPTGFRLGVVKGWQSSWFAERDYKDIWAEDYKIRQIINKELANASVSRIEIERTAADQVLVKVYTARPGIVIGKSGEKVDRLRNLLEAKTKKRRVRMDIIEIRQPELDATLVGRSIAEQLEKRVSFRRAMKQAVQKSMRANAKGIKVIVAGRLGGAEIARTEKEVEGKVPLQTLRADIDYGQAEAHTTFGVIGIKVWIYRGDILPTKRREAGEPQAEVATEQTFDRGDRRSRGDRQGGSRAPSPSRGGGSRSGEAGQRPPSPSRGSGSRSGEAGQRPPSPSRGSGSRSGEAGQRPQGPSRSGEAPRQPGTPQTDRPARQRPPRQPSTPEINRPRGGEAGQHPPRRQQPQHQGPASSENTTTPVEVTPPTPPTPTTDNGNAGTTQNE